MATVARRGCWSFYILIGAGLPQPACHLLSNHYNQTRSEYYRQLDRARQTDDGVLRFISYAIAGLVDGLNEQIGPNSRAPVGCRMDQPRTRDFLRTVLRLCGEPPTPTDASVEPILAQRPRSASPIFHTLDTDLGRAYATVTSRTLHTATSRP